MKNNFAFVQRRIIEQHKNFWVMPKLAPLAQNHAQHYRGDYQRQ
jgi:hypothetical protein